MGEHKRKALALAAPSGARPAPLTPEFVLSGDRVGQDGRLYTRDGQTVGLGPTHGTPSPFSRCVVISEAPMVWFYGELPARWLGGRGVHLDVVWARVQSDADRLRAMHPRGTWFFDTAAAAIETLTPVALAVSKAGGRLLVSCEADWWRPPPWFDPPDPAALRCFESVAQAAETLVVPSRRLGESVGARFHRPVAVIPPTLPPLADLPRARPRAGRGLRIGWVGSGTHLGDLELIGPAVLDLLARCPDVTFVLGSSFVPAWAQVHPRIERLFVGGMVSVMNYYRLLAALQLDIFLCPILAYPWNETKPCLKPLEAAGLGLPVIASRVGHYGEDLVDGETALLVENTPQAWLAALLRLVADADLRAHLAARGLEWAATRTIESTGPLWAALWGG
jgi:glycosyltransferase involved in cell wall biosynthesis